ncbi:MAG: cytochrome Cy, partial [Alphaproteobacteria bacterium HGW-Alphaproteobacteria-2]
MFDTMTLTKAVGSVCGALLFLLLAGWAAESLYHVGGGHGEHDQAYVIDTGSDDAADAPAAEEGPDFATLMAGADAAKGASSWSKCRACHALEEGKNGVGPYLAGIMGRDVAAASGFGYSDALKAIEGSWTAEQMDAWLTDPKSFAPGNKMTFAGIRSPEER